MNRRNFIQNSASVILPTLLNGFAFKAFGKENFLEPFLQEQINNSDKIFVLIQLFGGNDGLNTVVPISEYKNYINARKNIAIPQNKIVQLAGIDTFGLHPSLTGLRDLFNDGKLSILHSVGYPMPDFSHFRSSDIWMSGSDSNKSLTTGWMGRYLNEQYPNYPNGFPNIETPDPLAIQIGLATSFVFQGKKSPMAINISNPDNVYNLTNGFSNSVQQNKSGERLNYLRQVAQQTQAYSQVIKKAANRVENQITYPDNKLAAQLKIVAKLIKGGLKTKIYLVSYDGFDNHAQQVNANDTTTGAHADLLKITGDAIKSFQTDLEFLGIADKVSGMTFSEFGRRIASNDSLGTDHGAAAPLFIFGSNVKGGNIGNPPAIPENVKNDDNITMQIDFREIYATVFDKWLNLSTQANESILLNKFKPLDIFK